MANIYNIFPTFSCVAFVSTVDLCIPPEGQAVCNGRGTQCDLTVTSFSMATGVYDHEFACDCQSDDELVMYSGPTCDIALCNETFFCENGGECR